MKLNQAFSLCTICIIISLVSCHSPYPSSTAKAKISAVATKLKQKPDQDSLLQPVRVYAKEDSSCVIVNGKTLCISKKHSIDLKKAYPYIREIKNGIVHKTSCLTLGDFTLITTNSGTDRGYTELYAIDNKTKTLVKDKQFKRDHLSGFGVFVVNDYKIFTMHKYYYDKKDDFKSSGSLYTIKNDLFIYIKSRIEKEEISESDSAIINFSQRPLNKKF
ncbi:hypothetical protein [Mucilaginibacter sp. FT3.2]|uniref:hypothetical protein n=1 Tax=Mucilaginibacter sp. FT3.2 TaxID=2723090 RepID=UPI00161FE973|nr:hypothetical protein [Mucilaginibacter sp. FT3.2]MBB6233995.1 hypothetical protein [Mucilaginibacter sp. FT3.2]